MRIILIILTMSLLSCETIKLEEQLKLEEQNTPVQKTNLIKGRVSIILSNIFSISAHAQILDLGCIEHCPININPPNIIPIPRVPNEPQPINEQEFSELASQRDVFFDSISSGIEMLSPFTASIDSFKGEVRKLKQRIDLTPSLNISHNVDTFLENEDDIDQFGFIIISGFNNLKELESYYILPLESDGSFEVTDDKSNKVAFYSFNSVKPDSSGNIVIRNHISFNSQEVDNSNIEINPLTTAISIEPFHTLADSNSTITDVQQTIAEKKNEANTQTINNNNITDAQALILRARSILSGTNAFNSQYINSILMSLIAVKIYTNPSLKEHYEGLTTSQDDDIIQSLIVESIQEIDPLFTLQNTIIYVR